MASPLNERAESPGPRAWFRVVVIAALLLFLLPFHVLWRLFGWQSPWSKLFLRLAGQMAGADVTVVGTPRQGNVLYIANHVSWLDILVLAGQTGSAFVAKADMAPWPIIGWMATLNNSVYVAREDRLGVSAQTDAIKLALKNRQPLTLFPEGTTGDGRTLLAFRSSLVAAVTPPPEGVSVQPVAIDYGLVATEIAWTGDESVGHNALRVMSRSKRLQVTLHFIEPLKHDVFADRKALIAQSRHKIAAALGLS